jgi:Methyltransferase domain
MLDFLKHAIRRAIPKRMVAVYDDYRQERTALRNRRKSTEEVFTEIYSSNRWGGRAGKFFSGFGSHESAIVAPYIAMIAAELERIGAASMTAVDLGCGDYSVGRQISSRCGMYIGVDIVKALVAHNEAAYGRNHISFQHANIIEDPLPAGDICFVRQVLQHLSNQQIAAVLPKLDKFGWCYVTEHHPSPGKSERPNADKPHGDDIRVARGSGVFLDEPPFSIPAARYRLLLEVPGTPTLDGSDPGVIRTYLLSPR